MEEEIRYPVRRAHRRVLEPAPRAGERGVDFGLRGAQTGAESRPGKTPSPSTGRFAAGKMKANITFLVSFLGLAILGIDANPLSPHKRSIQINTQEQKESSPKFNASIDLDDGESIVINQKPKVPEETSDSSANLNVNIKGDVNITAKQDPTVDHYDQRQNGTENYRVKVDGLVFILAPAETLLLGAALEPNFTSFLSENKPKPKPEIDLFKPKPEKVDSHKNLHHEHHGPKSRLRISNLIRPLLNRIQHSQQQLVEK